MTVVGTRTDRALDAQQPTPVAQPDPTLQAGAFDTLFRTLGSEDSRRAALTQPTPAKPARRAEPAELTKHGTATSALSLSDAAKLDYGSLAALQLRGDAPASATTEPGPETPEPPAREAAAPSRSAPSASTRSSVSSSPEANRDEDARPAAPASTPAPASQHPEPPAEPAAIKPQPASAAVAVAARSATPAASPVTAAASPPAPSAAIRPGATAVGPVQGAPGVRSARQMLSRLEAQGPKQAAEPHPHVRQVARALLSAVRTGQGEVSLRLLPEALGKVTVRLEVRDETVAATILPHTAPARDLLEKSKDELRSALEARGLRVERIEIDPSRVEPAHTAGPEAPGMGNAGEGGPGTPHERQGTPAHTPSSEAGTPIEIDLPTSLPVSWFDPSSLRTRIDALA